MVEKNTVITYFYRSSIVCSATTPHPSSVANGGFAPLGGAAATPVAALKPPVAFPKEGTTLGAWLPLVWRGLG